MVELTQDQKTEIVRHAQEEAPNECCGLLMGRDGKVELVIRGTNVAESRPTMMYSIDSETLLQIPKLEKLGLDVVAIYHSHPHSEALPSTTDRLNATYPDSYYVIVSLMNPDLPELKAFRILGQHGEAAVRREVVEARVVIR